MGGIVREIKFRLIKDGEIVGYERHILDANGEMKMQHSLTGDIWNDIIDEGGSFNCFISHNDKNQFTGKKDKKGKEIYEGSICKITEKAFAMFDEKISVSEVKWSQSECRYIIGDYALTDDLTQNGKFEVIGDIYSKRE